MELSPGKQRLLFVALVILLAAIGIYLVGPGRSHGAPSAGQSSSGAAGGSSPSATPLNVPSAAVAPSPLPVPTSIKNANIYGWLPFSQQDLDAAANVTVAFAAADQTFSSTDTAKTYGQRLQSLVTPTFLGILEEQFRPPGATAMSSKSGGTIRQIATFGSTPQASITFVVTITDQTTTGGTTKSTSGQYDVTAEAVAGGWQVNDVEQAGQGNQGQANQ